MRRLLLLLAMLVLTFASKVAAADIALTPGAANYLPAPVPYPDPDPVTQPKEWFFNYRLEKFAPSQEPLIHETFGNSVTAVDEDSVWEYPSVNSFAFSFATNLPTLARLEYGPTSAYGQMSSISDSYYYNHLLHLTDLDPDTTYHYRLVVQDYDGNSYVSPDRTFTTTNMNGKVAITQAMIPFTMANGSLDANKHYVVTEDLSSPTFGIKVGNAYNVIIDLNGHTLTYDQGPHAPDEKARGVTVEHVGGVLPYDVAVINGIIKQGVLKSNGTAGTNYEPVYLGEMWGETKNEIAGVSVEYFGDDLAGIVANRAKVHHNVLYDQGTAVEDRHGAIRALAAAQDASFGEITYNSLRRFRQRGIDGWGTINHNELYSDSQVTNSFAIGNGSDSEVAYNKIFGLGYMPVGIGWGEHDSNTHDNFIFERCFAPYRRSGEYDRDSSVAGIRFINYSGTTPHRNLYYTDNVISLLAENGCSLARGVWLSSDLVSENIVVARNKVKVIAAADNNTCPTQNNSPYYNCEVNNALASLVLGGTAYVEAAYTKASVIEDNHLISNIGFVVIGEGYGTGNGLKLKRTTFERVGPDLGQWFYPVRLGFWYWTALNNRFIDNTLIGLTASEFEPYFYGGTGSMEAYYGRSRQLTFRDGDNSNAPITNTESVIIVNADDPDTDAEQFFLQTDSNGVAAAELIDSYHHKLGNNLENGGIAGTPTHYYYNDGTASTYDFYVYGYQTKRLTKTQVESATEIIFNKQAAPSPIPAPPTPIPAPTPTPRPTPMPVTPHTPGTLEPPILYPNPDPQENPDEWFFNYRHEQLDPGNEPLIAERFGDELRLDPESFWQYPSFNSVAVSFAFEVPVVALVEYGQTTSYGQFTPQSDAYFYNHLFHLRDLQPGTTYHFRFKALARDGQTYTSPDYQVTTLAWTDYPNYRQFDQADMPLLIEDSNTHWVATSDLEADRWGINARADNVVIDLNGYTLIYEKVALDCAAGNDCYYDEELPYGIRSGLWSKKNISIFNGVVKQGHPYGQTSSYGPISLFHMDGETQNEVAGVWVDYYGDGTPGIALQTGKIHHSVIYDRGESVTDRHNGVRAVSMLAPAAGQPPNEAYYNSLRRFRQRGLDGPGIIHHNELYVDSQVTNSIAIGNGNETQVYANKIFGLGYLAIGVGWGSHDSLVRDNLVFLRCYAPNKRSDEYSRWAGAAGFRITNFDNEPLQNLIYEDNLISIIAEKSAGAGSECIGARGIWGSNGVGDVADGVIFRRNTVKVEALANNHDVPNGGYYPGVTAFYPYGESGNAVAPVSMQGSGALDTSIPQAVIFEDNHLLSNVNLVLIGEGYGIGSGMRFYNTKFEKIARADDWFQPIRIGYWYYNTLGNKFINNEVVGFGVGELETVQFFGGSGKMEARFGFGHDYNFVTDGGGAIAGVTVTYASGSAVATVETGSAGQGYLEFITSYHHKLGNNGDGETFGTPPDQIVHGIPTHEYYDLDSVYTFSAAGYESANYTLAELETLETIVLRRSGGSSNGGNNSSGGSSGVGGGGGSGSGSTSPPQVWRCSLSPPHAAPDLFEVRARKNQAQLYFTPVQGYGNSYLVSFHETPVAEGHGASVTLYPEGVQSYDIYHLKPNTTYYLKVAAQNGCQVGPWSDVLTFKTPGFWSTGVKASYKYPESDH